jgi:hypothetical protein
MSEPQREQNPDVNSYDPDSRPGETPGSRRPGDGSNIESNHNDDVIPVPPDAKPSAPVEEPPGSDKPPAGDVDDSPKLIV